eukprot:12738922-Ditylum_brightwellii.AAC.1
MANNDSNENDVGYAFMDERISVVFGLDNCCNNHICKVRKLFKELREAPIGKRVLGIGGVCKLEGIGTIIFQVTDDEGRVSSIELENVLYIPNTPKNLISITQWSEDRQDNCRVFNQRKIFNLYAGKRLSPEVSSTPCALQNTFARSS